MHVIESVHKIGNNQPEDWICVLQVHILINLVLVQKLLVVFIVLRCILHKKFLCVYVINVNLGFDIFAAECFFFFVSFFVYNCDMLVIGCVCYLFKNYPCTYGSDFIQRRK